MVNLCIYKARTTANCHNMHPILLNHAICLEKIYLLQETNEIEMLTDLEIDIVLLSVL